MSTPKDIIVKSKVWLWVEVEVKPKESNIGNTVQCTAQREAVMAPAKSKLNPKNLLIILSK